VGRGGSLPPRTSPLLSAFGLEILSLGVHPKTTVIPGYAAGIQFNQISVEMCEFACTGMLACCYFDI